jgi:hypothetical protein
MHLPIGLEAMYNAWVYSVCHKSIALEHTKHEQEEAISGFLHAVEHLIQLDDETLIWTQKLRVSWK